MNRSAFFFLIVVMLLGFFADHVFAHKQHVHQYFVREGYNVLQLYLGNDIPQIVSHIGSDEGYSGSGPWSTELLGDGAYIGDVWKSIHIGSSFRCAGADQVAKEKEKNIRSLFLFSSIGLIEVFSIGAGIQLSDNFSISVKYAGTWIGSGFIFPNSAAGPALRVGFHKPFLLFNTVSLDYIIYLYSSLDWESLKMPWRLGYEPFIKGHYFDFNIGKETIDESGFNFFWAIGFCISAAKEAQILYAPSLKIGINLNFIK